MILFHDVHTKAVKAVPWIMSHSKKTGIRHGRLDVAVNYQGGGFHRLLQAGEGGPDRTLPGLLRHPDIHQLAHADGGIGAGHGALAYHGAGYLAFFGGQLKYFALLQALADE